jgi:hypothetical protein
LEKLPNLIKIIVETDKNDIPSTQLHDHPLSWLGTPTSTKSGGVKQISHLRSHKKFMKIKDGFSGRVV